MFVEKNIDPFIEPFRDWAFVKFGLFTSGVIAEVTGFIDLFSTDINYAYLLFSLIILDSIGKIIKIYFIDHSQDFSFDLLLRKLIYKTSSYLIVCIAFVMFSNQFEPDVRRLEFGAFFGLSLLELFSVAGHFKLVGYIIAIVKQLGSGKLDFEKLKQEADKYNIKKNKD